MSALPGVVESYYTVQDLATLWRFSERKIRDLVKSGAFVLRDGDRVVAQPLEIAGEIRIPASAINAFAASHTYAYDGGVKARNQGELTRRLAQRLAA